MCPTLGLSTFAGEDRVSGASLEEGLFEEATSESESVEDTKFS